MFLNLAFWTFLSFIWYPELTLGLVVKIIGLKSVEESLKTFGFVQVRD
jgi:hypothetical protein